MTYQKIKEILSTHAVDTKEVNGRLYAEDLYTINQELRSQWIDVSRFNDRKLRDFLSY